MGRPKKSSHSDDDVRLLQRIANGDAISIYDRYRVSEIAHKLTRLESQYHGKTETQLSKDPAHKSQVQTTRRLGASQSQ